MTDREKLIFLHGCCFGSANATDPDLDRKLAIVLGLPPTCLQSPESGAIQAEVLALVAAAGHIEVSA
jgi:hypothetical protein